MNELIFLEAPQALTKSFTLDVQGNVQKTSYLDAYLFTSHHVPVTTLHSFFNALKKHAALGHCMLKGVIKTPLINESRAGSTTSDDVTWFMVLDMDSAPFSSPAEFMASEPALADVSYIVQYSASAGLDDAEGLNCHIFVMLDKPYHAHYLKAWLMSRNLSTEPGLLREALSLTKTKAYLHFPLDVTASQNDKLIYIAPPIIGKGVKYSLKTGDLIQYVAAKLPTLPIARLDPPAIEAMNEQKRTIINDLREEAGIKKLRAETKWIGEYEVQAKPGVATITGIKAERGFIYFNLNGGKSWGYFHPEGAFELIHNFKGEPSYLTKELLPDYYKECRIKLKKENASPCENGELLLAFRDIRTGAYWNGTWDADNAILDLNPAKSELQLDHFMQSKGKTIGDFVVPWRMEFNPTSDVTVDVDAKFINTFILPPLLRGEFALTKNLDACPTIKRVILSAVSNNKWDDTTEHFLNWLAVIFQHRIKTGTAWILHGTQGTGKGVLVHNILAPTLGELYVQARRMSELEEKYSGWLETSLVAFIDEVQVSSSQRKDLITGDLKNFITDKRISIRHMNRASYSALNYTNFIFGSNMPDPVQLPRDDRRYNTGHYQKKRLELGLKAIAAIADELPAFVNYIMTRRACVDTAATVLASESRDAVIAASRNSLDMVGDALREGDLAFLYDSLPDMKMLAELNGSNSAYGTAFNEIIKREARLLLSSKPSARSPTHHVDSKLSRDELLVIFEFCIGNMPTSPNKFTRLLKYRGLEIKRIRVGEASKQGVDVKWVVPSEWLAEHRAELTEAPQMRRVK